MVGSSNSSSRVNGGSRGKSMIAFDDVGATGNEAIWPTAGKTGICSIYPHILYIYTWAYVTDSAHGMFSLR